MSSVDSLINISVEKDIESRQVEELDTILLDLVERLDFIDVQILRKFYTTGKEFPNDTQPYCFPILYKEMKEVHRLKIGMEALRKRLDILVKFGFLGKINNSNPTNYSPINGKEKLIRAVIMKFFLINGLNKFL
jgi:hypothetical protein